MTMRDLIDDCVHCGFCLPACPTYASWSEEMDSPRGRIYLMRGLRDGTVTWDATVASHFDRCLGCMACVTACPSGVKYDALIETTRVTREAAVPRSGADAAFRTLVFSLFPYPARLRVVGVLLWIVTALGLRAWAERRGVLTKRAPRLAQLQALSPELSLGELTRTLPVATRAEGEQRGRIGLVAGCVQRVFFPSVNDATLRVLAKEGFEVVVPAGQGCCGALSLHAGREAEAKAFAQSLIRLFEDAAVDTIVVNAAGCGSSLKEYGRLFDDDRDWRERARLFSAKVRDVSELLASVPPRAPRHPLAARVAYHDACHLAHAQRIRREPRALLAGIPGLTVCEIPDGDQCCGSAGIYNLVEPASANEIGARKVDNVLSTHAKVMVSANPGCTLHVQRLVRARGARLRAMHPIEVLDHSLRGVQLDADSDSDSDADADADADADSDSDSDAGADSGADSVAGADSRRR
jgi:glycolate oxidase iron-sulfur subunit